MILYINWGIILQDTLKTRKLAEWIVIKYCKFLKMNSTILLNRFIYAIIITQLIYSDLRYTTKKLTLTQLLSNNKFLIDKRSFSFRQ